MFRLLGLATAILLSAMLPATAEGPAKCAPGDAVLWADGEHDDTAGLNAWLRGETVVWARTGEDVGAEIADRTFRLGEAIYIHAGTDRTLVRFRFVWPARGEVVSADSLSTGSDPNREPVAANLRITGGDPDEGIAFDGPDPVHHNRSDPSRCLTS